MKWEAGRPDNGDVSECSTRMGRMSWDKRGKNGPYYYRSIRVGVRVRKVYVGRGQQAEEVARQIEQQRKERQAQREAQKREQGQMSVAEQRLQEIQDLADALMRAVFIGMGLHEHKGEWRRRRNGRNSRVERES